LDKETKDLLIANVADSTADDATLEALIDAFHESMIEFLETLTDTELIKYATEYYPEHLDK
jgi:hypothetical protein